MNLLTDFFGTKMNIDFSKMVESLSKKNEMNNIDKSPMVKFPSVFPKEFKISGTKPKSNSLIQSILKIDFY